MSERLRIVVADDHPAMLEWLVTKLGEECDVVASVNSGAAALEAVKRFDPDVVVLDLAMAPVNGLEVTRSLRENGTRAGVVLVTAYSEPELAKVGFAAGAQAFVIKSNVIEDLLPAVRKAALKRQSAGKE